MEQIIKEAIEEWANNEDFIEVLQAESLASFIARRLKEKGARVD